MNVVVSPGLRTNSAATPSPCRPSGKRLTSETFIPCASKIAPRPSRTTWWGRRGEVKTRRQARRKRTDPPTPPPTPTVLGVFLVSRGPLTRQESPTPPPPPAPRQARHQEVVSSL